MFVCACVCGKDCFLFFAMAVPWLTGGAAAASTTAAKKPIATGWREGKAALEGAARRRTVVRGTARGAAKGVARRGASAKAASQCGQLAAAKSAKSKMKHSRQLAAATHRQLAAAQSAKSKMKHSRQLAAATHRQLAAATHRKTRLARNVSTADVDLLLGSVAENDGQHCARHKTYGQGAFRNCLRCVTIRRRDEIARVAPWAAPRPYHLGGAWRMGCRICAAGRWTEEVGRRRSAHMEANARSAFCKQSISRCSVWGKFQFARAGDFRRLKGHMAAHAAKDFHRLCADVVLSPRFMLAPMATQYLKAQGHAEQKASGGQELTGRLDDAAPTPASQSSGQPAAPTSAAQSSGQPAAPTSAAQSSGQPAAPRKETLQSYAGTLDIARGSIQDPFRGNIPQREDWVEVWADSSSAIGFRKQEAVKEKRSEPQIERRRKRQMVAVEAEVVRESCRKRLRQATSATVAFDECDTRKVIRVRCDTPEPPHQWDGVIGIVRKQYGVTDDVSAELKDDHAVHNLRLLGATLRAFYTPLPPKLPRKKRGQPAAAVPASGGALPTRKRKRSRASQRQDCVCNEDELMQFRKKVRTLASDGGSAERRALFVAACQYFPNAHFVIEDPAHGLRIAMVKPLQLETYLAEIQEELFNKQHALLPDIQNSGKWKQMLLGLQTNVLRMPGLRSDGALKVVLQHLAYSKVRMDSTADPLAKLCLMLMPVAFLLSFISADERCNSAQRDRARRLLSKFQPKFLTGAGAAADWGLICIAFLRLFDRLNHDISNSADELKDFCDTIEACFVQGGVFCRTPRGGSDSQPAAAMFITERVRKQIACKCVFHCGSSEQVVWGPIPPADLKELSSSLCAAAQAMIARVKAKLGGLRRHFSCFALRRIRRAEEASAEEKERLQSALSVSLKALGAAFRVDGRILAFEYRDAVPAAMLLYEKELRAQKDAPASGGDHSWFDNRRVWAKFLDKSFVENAFPGRVAPFTVLPTLLRVWLSILDGEAQVERDLGFMRGFAKAGKGRSHDQLLDDLLLLKVNGPKTGEEARGKFAVQCAELWRKHNGSAAVQKQRRTPRQPAAPRRKCGQATFADAKRAVLRASVSAKIPRRAGSMTAYGVTADFFKPSPEEVRGNCVAWSEGLKEFDKLTKAYKVKNVMFGKFGRSAFPKFKVLASTKQRNPPDYSHIRLLAYLPAYNSAACGAMAAGYETRSGLHACRTAHMAIVDDLGRFHSDEADVEWVMHVLYIVARGIPITTAAGALSANGEMKTIPATSLREHEPQMKRRLLFLIAKKLNDECPALATALRAVEQMTSSAWRVELTDEIGVPAQSARATAASGASRQTPPNGASSTARRPKAAAKRRGRPVAAAKEVEVRVPDLATMWAWLKSNRRTVNAKYTRMCWRHDLPTPI